MSKKIISIKMYYDKDPNLDDDDDYYDDDDNDDWGDILYSGEGETWGPI